MGRHVSSRGSLAFCMRNWDTGMAFSAVSQYMCPEIRRRPMSVTQITTPPTEPPPPPMIYNLVARFSRIKDNTLSAPCLLRLTISLVWQQALLLPLRASHPLRQHN